MHAHGENVYCPRCGREIYPASEPCRNCGFGADQDLTVEQIEELKVLAHKLLIISRTFVPESFSAPVIEMHNPLINILDLDYAGRYGGLNGKQFGGQMGELVRANKRVEELTMPL